MRETYLHHKELEVVIWAPGTHIQMHIYTQYTVEGAHPSHSQSPPLFHLRPQGNQIEAKKHRHGGHDDHQHGSAAVVGPVKALAWRA